MGTMGHVRSGKNMRVKRDLHLAAATQQPAASVLMSKWQPFKVDHITVIGEILHIFPSGNQNMGAKKAYTGLMILVDQIWL